MTHKQRGRGARPAFTLIELLVVISIIAILVGLLSAAVMRVLIKGPELQTVSEINLFNTKLSAEQRDLNTKILPSHLRLREDSNYKDPAWSSGQPLTALQTDYNLTEGFLQQTFGRHIAGVQIDWNGDGTITTTSGAGGDLVLEGEQCLVYWLGGAAKQAGSNVGMIGFPFGPGGTQQSGVTIGPYYEFQSNRLKMFQAPDPLNNNSPSLPFPVYVDPWGTNKPYAYFCSYSPAGNGLYQADCPSLGVKPYQELSGKWTNASSCQIISAGRNGLFGPGGSWNPAAGLGSTGPGSDDQSNFSPHLLGIPAN